MTKANKIPHKPVSRDRVIFDILSRVILVVLSA